MAKDKSKNESKYGSSEPKTFKPRARLLQLLGDQLIRDPRIGVFELVKNAYDADSPSVDVIFRNIDKPEKSKIEINDTGDGMDFKTVTEVWLEPGTDNREKQRKAGNRTSIYKRLPIGEKGVGRFATHKLGNKVCMITRKQNNKEIVVDIDWDDLTSRNKYLSETPINISERSPKIFKGDKHGTQISISHLRHTWTRGDIRRLFRSVNSISSPHASDDPFIANFKMMPKNDWLDDMITASDIENLAMFLFEFTIKENTFDFKYEFRPINALLNEKTIKPRTEEKKDQLLEYFQMRINETGKRKRRRKTANLSKLGIGTIKGKILGYDRDPEVLNYYIGDTTSITNYLDHNGGIRVYRDGIRVYDYGEPENDWLGLDERRIQIPAKRVSNNLILGEVHLNLEESPALIEKTNREGFVENQAYKEFNDAVLCAIARFEQERSKDKETIRELSKLKKLKGHGEGHYIQGPEDAIANLKERVIQTGLQKKIGRYVDEVEKTYLEMRETLLGAVGSGLGLTIVFHEIERGIRGLHNSIIKGADSNRIKEMSHHLVELLKGTTFLISTTKKKSIKASDIAKHAIFNMSPRFDYHKIEIVNAFENLPDLDFEVNGSRRMLVASLVNMIDNSIHWLNAYKGTGTTKGKKSSKRIWIGPSNNLEGPSIVIADNGPGFEDNPEDIVRPFFTRKTEGMGIGLYFANLAMRAHEGRLSFPAKNDVVIPKAYNGAILAMVFKK